MTETDHFTSNGASSKFSMRYLVNETYAQGKTNPPILFYCGNEGNVTTFWDNSGFMTKNLSVNMSAVLLFGEHRYYGESLPFGKNYSWTPQNVSLLTVDQALMDYVKLIKSFKANNTAYAKSPVYAFGGSYGGMLAAWFRMKYPHIIQGAHAASAPIMFFPGSVSPYAFNEMVSRTFRDSV
jgi:lysosomal Pro-X carboxypeptidase